MGLGRDEAHLIRRRRARSTSARGLGQLRLAVGAARTADDDERDVGVVELGEDTHRESAGPSAAGCARRTAARAARRGRARSRAPSRSPGENIAWSTPGATISMRSGSASYSVASCVAFVLGRREHEVGARDHVVLERGAQLRIVVDTGIGLDARERVERRYEREVELVLEPVRDAHRRASSSRAARRLVATREQLSRATPRRRDRRGRAARASATGATRAGLDVHDAEAGLDDHDRRVGPGARRGCRRRTRHRPGRATPRALRRRRSCRRRRPHPAARAATCAC